MGHWEGWTRGPTVGIPRRFDPSADQAPALASARPGATHDDPLQRKALPRPRFLPAASRPIASLALAAVLAGGALPAPVAAGDVAAPIPEGRSAQLDTTISVDPGPAVANPAAPGVTGDDSTAVPDLHPSIAYEQAMAHEHDRIDFKPGGRVTVGFTPRARDRWPVDGRAPAAAAGGQGDRARDGGEPPGQPAGRAGRGQPARPTTRRPDRRERDQLARRRPRRQAGHRRVRRRLHRAARRGRRRPRRRLRPPPPGVRLPALLGASARRPSSTTTSCRPSPTSRSAPIATGNLRKKDPDGTNTTGWGGWTSSNMTSVINARPPARHPGRAHGQRVRVDHRPGERPARAPRQRAAARLNLARQVAAAVRDRGADGVNLDFEPLASGYADEFVALLRTVRTRAQQGPQGLPAHLRHDRRSSGTTRSRPRWARARRTRSSSWATTTAPPGPSTAGSIDPLSRPRLRPRRHRPRVHGARQPESRIILGLPWYGRAWSTATTPSARSQTLSGAKYGYSTAVNYENVVALVAQVRPPLGRRSSRARTSPTGARTARRPTAASPAGGRSTTTTRVAQAALRDRQRLRAARRRDVGARATTAATRELYRAVAGVVPRRQVRPAGRHPDRSRGDPGRRGVRRLVGGARHQQRRLVRRPGLGQRRPRGPRGCAATTRDVGRLARRADGARLRVPRPGDRPQGQRRLVERRRDLGRDSPSLATGGFGRVVADGLSYRSGPDTSAAKLGTLKAGTIVAITRGPVSPDGYTWYEVTEPIREWSPVSFVERGVWIAARSSSDTWSSPTGRPTARTVDAGLRGLDFGSGPGSALGSGPAALAIRAFSPNGDGSEDAIRLRWTQHRRPRLADAQRLPHQRLARRVALRAGRSAPARRRGTGTARIGGAAPSGTGATSSSWSGAPGAGRSTRRPARPTTPPRSPRSA